MPKFSRGGRSGKSNKKRETELDDTPGVPSRVIPIRLRFFMTKIEKSRLAPKNIPNGYFYKKNSTAELEVQYIVFFIKQIRKSRKGTGMTRLGSPGVSSQSVSGLSKKIAWARKTSQMATFIKRIQQRN